MMENTIKPDVERWRGTLDTILIFVSYLTLLMCTHANSSLAQIALFSAVVTSFLVQAITGLSQDPSDRTNELISNLTDVIIQLSAVKAASLTLASPAPFEPDSDTVRLNVYWSLSLIVSVSWCCP